MTDAAVVALRDALADRLQDAFDDLLAYLERATVAGQSADDALDAYQWPSLVGTVADQQVLDALARAYIAGAHHASGALGVAWGLSPLAAQRFARARAAELVGMREVPAPVMPRDATRPKMRRIGNRWYVPNPSARWAITDSTRDFVKREVQDTLATPGVSYQNLYDHLRASPAFAGLFGEQRAEMVARTELALAANHGTIDTYREHGLDRVRVLDNADCPICGPVAGTIQTVAWAAENALGHPHCIRAFQPVENAA